MSRHLLLGRRTLLIAASMLLAQVAIFAQSPNLEALDSFVNQALKDFKVPGAAVAIVKDDKLIYAKGFGLREVGKAEPVTANTIFAIGSSSKAFTAASLAMLVDEGKVKWNDPVTKHIPWFQLYDPNVTREATVTDLLTHRLGLERGDRLWYASGLSRDDVIRQVRYLKPTWSVRSNFGYQNIMYITAGQIIPAATGKSWDEFIKDRFFTPLGMKSSSTSTNDLGKYPDVATPHIWKDGGMKPVKWRNIDNAGPAGSINSNVTDMAQWLRLQIGSGTIDGKALISKERFADTHKSYSILGDDWSYRSLYAEAHFMNYGLGWFLSDYKGKKLVEHGGAIDGMRAEVAVVPEEKLGIVVLTNMGSTGLPSVITFRALDIFLGGNQRDWSAIGMKFDEAVRKAGKDAEEKAVAARVAGTNPSLALDRYTGDFVDQMYGQVQVGISGERLSIRAGSGFKGELTHWNYDTFLATWSDDAQGKSLVKFRLDSSGKVESVVVEGLAEFKRISK